MTFIICELNPLHNGHKYLMDTASKSGPVCLIMSGNFTQRGSAAVFDKYTRAELAARCGADLVLELPYPWCCAGAADFARAGVSLACAFARALGGGRLMFGSGCGDAALLERAGNAFADTDFDTVFLGASRDTPTEGAARIRDRLLSELFDSEELRLLSNPNDILGVEYYRYARVLGGIECVPVGRTSGDGVASATELRRIISEEGVARITELVPTEVTLRSLVPVPENRLYDIEREVLRMDLCDTDGCAEAEGGLGRRLRGAAGKSANGTEMLGLAATKKYTASRIRRAALYCALGTRRADIRKAPLFTTVLAMRETGAEILKSIKGRCEIEVLTKAGSHKKLSPEAAEQFAHLAAADRLYTMLMPQAPSEDHFLTVTPWIEGRD